MLETTNFRANSDGFIFDQEIVTQIVAAGLVVTEVPVPVRYFPMASSASFFESTKYGFGILWLMFRYTLHRIKIWRSLQFESLALRYREA